MNNIHIKRTELTADLIIYSFSQEMPNSTLFWLVIPRILNEERESNNENCFELTTLRKSVYPIDAKNLEGLMVLDALFFVKNYIDSTLSFRRSCREGICGSCSVNINGLNTLSCILDWNNVRTSTCLIHPIPNFLVKRDLVVDLKRFWTHYNSISPWINKRSLIATNDSYNKKPGRLVTYSKSFDKITKTIRASENWSLSGNKNAEWWESSFIRSFLNGIYECVLCACCSSSCPSYWWQSELYLGPAVLLQMSRWVNDIKDDFLLERISYMKDYYRLFQCHNIFNCTKTCPKNLNPGVVILNLKKIYEVELVRLFSERILIDTKQNSYFTNTYYMKHTRP